VFLSLRYSCLIKQLSGNKYKECQGVIWLTSLECETCVKLLNSYQTDALGMHELNLPSLLDENEVAVLADFHSLSRRRSAIVGKIRKRTDFTATKNSSCTTTIMEALLTARFPPTTVGIPSSIFDYC
jgi:hypothetical protein